MTLVTKFMSRYTQLRDDLKKYMLSKETDKVGTLRYLISKINNFAIEQRKQPEELSDSEVEQVLIKIGKQQAESIEAFAKGNRPDLVEKEQAQLDILNAYLPTRMNEQETLIAIEEIMNELNITSVSQMGQLMAEVKKRYGSQIDMGVASKIARGKLV